jgi:hypothetical protein
MEWFWLGPVYVDNSNGLMVSGIDVVQVIDFPVKYTRNQMMFAGDVCHEHCVKETQTELWC